MNQATPNRYLLLSCSDAWYHQLSHAELQHVLAANQAWMGRLMATGKGHPGVALRREGVTVSARKVISDGPYAEAKEAIGGTLTLEVPTLEEAIAIAKTCPSLQYGGTIEIRPISDECPLEACARAQKKTEPLVPASV